VHTTLGAGLAVAGATWTGRWTSHDKTCPKLSNICSYSLLYVHSTVQL